MTGLLCTPLSFMHIFDAKTKPFIRYTLSAFGMAFLNGISPPVVLLVGCKYFGVSLETVLTEAAFGWDVWGMWTQVVVWCVWWPAWVVGGVVLGGGLFS